MKKFLLLLLCLNFSIPAQDSEITFTDFTLQLTDQVLIISDKNDNVLYEKIFNHPSGFTADLDEDGIEEYLVIDSSSVDLFPLYTLFIFNTIDSFNLIDSILCGSMEPYHVMSEELGMTVIVAGNPKFQIFITNPEEFFLPVNCWRYEGSELFLVNDEIYEIFLEENEGIVDYLDEKLKIIKQDCNFGQDDRAAIAAAYANYINAGEESVASQFLKKYYLCDDIKEFKNQLRELTTGKLNEDGLE